MVLSVRINGLTRQGGLGEGWRKERKQNMGCLVGLLGILVVFWVFYLQVPCSVVNLIHCSSIAALGPLVGGSIN